MKIAILGYATEGQLSYEYFLDQGHNVTICDENPGLETPDGAQTILGEHCFDNLDRFDLLVRTAGLPPHKILDKNPTIGNKITTNINEFFKASPTKNIIGVTGTKGKGTTSTLITNMLQATGKHVFLVGNIGVAALSVLSELTADSWVVLELSSFQLMDVQYSPHIGVCLMVVPEHLDWHKDLNEYLTAKQQLFRWQTADDVAIYYSKSENSKWITGISTGNKIPYFEAPGAEVIDNVISIDGQTICHTNELQLLGKHNWQNACAAVTAVWQVTQDTLALHSVLTSFTGLEHRLELVREVNGVHYYDDSFGTTPETAMVAVEAFVAPKVVIVGGSSKGADFDALAQTIAANNVKQVIIMGNTTHSVYTTDSLKIKTALENQHLTNVTALISDGGPTMAEIVATAKAAAEPGDVVILSAGCASFDMFQNYKDRGDQFKAAVNAL